MSSHTCLLWTSDAPSSLKPVAPVGCGGKRGLSAAVLGDGGKHVSGTGTICSPKESGDDKVQTTEIQEWRPKVLLSPIMGTSLTSRRPELCSQDAFSDSGGLHR